MTESAFARHAGLAQSEEGDILLESGQFIYIGPDGVDQSVDTLGEKYSFEVVPDKGTRLGVAGQERFQFLVAETDIMVFNDGPSRVISVPKSVVGQYPQPLGFIHVGHDSGT